VRSGIKHLLMDLFTRLPELLQETIVGLVRQRQGGLDLTARQLAVLLVCYLDEGPHTMPGLAAQLGVSRSAITRALVRLELDDLAKRRPDPTNRRSIVIVRTIAGSAFMGELRALMKSASKGLGLSLAAPRSATG
jgi:DNA-binding MarR family transcriptional regulator